MDENFVRDTFVFENDFWEFYNAQKKSVQDKIDWVIGIIRTFKVIPDQFFKHIEGSDGLFEIKIKVVSDIFRIFCFFDEGKLIILLNGFQKKTEKTPQKELIRAKILKQKYYERKYGSK